MELAALAPTRWKRKPIEETENRAENNDRHLRMRSRPRAAEPCA